MKIKESIKNEIISILSRHLGREYLLFVFGSLAANNSNRSSDIDIAVYRSKEILPRIISEIREELNEQAHTLKDIDLVNLTEEGIASGLLENILAKGIIWRKPKNFNDLWKNLQKRLANTKR
ncbi:MAG: nucleotidyltransferase domain-containing protein [Elusimicrobiota bacterium]